MRILICTNAYPPHFMGGAELVAHEQAKLLSRRGHEVAVFAGDIGAPGDRHARIDDVYDGLPVHRIKTTPDDYNPSLLNFLHPAIDVHFENVLGSFRPDIVHFHNLMGLSVKLPIIASAAGARTICTLHDLWGFCLLNTAIRSDGLPCHNIAQCRSCLPLQHDGNGVSVPMRFRKDFIAFAFAHIERFIAPSRYIADRYIAAGLSGARISVIPNGVDLERFAPTERTSDDGMVRISFAGYFGAHKGVNTLIAAFAALGPRRDIVLQLAGGGPEEERYQTQIEALAITDRVRFFGRLVPAAMPSFYADSDIVVLPSVWDENQPVCLMEAMASGLPIVASNKGGIPELIDHARNGLLFAAGDADALSAHLRDLVDDPAARAAMGRLGRLRVERLAQNRQIDVQQTLYSSLLGQTLPSNPSPARFVGRMRSGTLVKDSATAPGLQNRAHYFIPYAWLQDQHTRFSRTYILAGSRLRKLLLSLTSGRLRKFLLPRGHNTAIRCPGWLYDLGMKRRRRREGFGARKLAAGKVTR
jgi:glycosyltransferase involved in cell wall biosynthesis